MNKKDEILTADFKALQDTFGNIDLKINSFVCDKGTAKQISSYFFEPDTIIIDKLCPLCDEFLFEKSQPMYSEPEDFYIFCRNKHYSYESNIFEFYGKQMIINNISINNLDQKEIFEEFDLIVDEKKKNEFIKELSKIMILK